MLNHKAVASYAFMRQDSTLHYWQRAQSHNRDDQLSTPQLREKLSAFRFISGYQ